MSSVILSGDTSGTITVTAPLVAGSNTVTLPAATGTVELLTQATAVSASGTSVDFTGLPSWVKKITVMISNLSTSGTSPVIIQLGTTSGFQTTGYTSAGSTQAGTVVTATTGLAILTSITAASNSFGNSTINLVGSNVWAQSGLFTLTGSIRMSGGGVTLSDTLTQVRITTVNGTDTFDAGTINIIYEG